jgi:geranylgeranyl pyrophosphate synthase
MRLFGESIGIAFQIRDDILDYEGKASLQENLSAEILKKKKLHFL